MLQLLETPLGNIEIRVDGMLVDYQWKELKKGKLFPDIAARYKICVELLPDGKEHEISCTLKELNNQEYVSDMEPGECLECHSFYAGGIKLSIGIESDAGYLSDGCRVTENGYDYDSTYKMDGIAYNILPFTKTRTYVFGICWIEGYTSDTETQTWFGSDPTIM